MTPDLLTKLRKAGFPLVKAVEGPLRDDLMDKVLCLDNEITYVVPTIEEVLKECNESCVVLIKSSTMSQAIGTLTGNATFGNSLMDVVVNLYCSTRQLQ